VEATEGEGLWSKRLHQGTLSEVAKPQQRGGKSAGRERRPKNLPPLPPPPRGKGGVANEQQL